MLRIQIIDIGCFFRLEIPDDLQMKTGRDKDTEPIVQDGVTGQVDGENKMEVEKPQKDEKVETDKKVPSDGKMEVDPKEENTHLGYDFMGKYYRIWVLKPGCRYGTIDFMDSYSRMHDQRTWVRAVPDTVQYQLFLKDFFGLFYPELTDKVFVTRYKPPELLQKSVAKLREAGKQIEEANNRKRKAEEDPEQPLPKVPNTGTGPVTAPVVAANPPSVIAPAPTTDATGMQGISALMAQAVPTAQLVAPEERPQVPPLRLPWATLVKFGLAVGDLEIFPISVVVSAPPKTLKRCLLIPVPSRISRLYSLLKIY